MKKTEDVSYVFDEQWFVKHQQILLWFLNAAFIKIWFRWCLRIRKCDCSRKTRITQIGPNRFSWGDAEVEETCKQYRKHLHGADRRRFDKFHRSGKCSGLHRAKRRITDFRTNNKFSRRLYYAFRPLWYLIHCWDLTAARLIPALDLGFSTLTVFPDPGNPGTNTCNGWVTGNAAAPGIPFLTLRTTPTSSSVTQGTGNLALEIAGIGSGWISISRVFHLYLTSSLGSNASISRAIQSGYGQFYNNNTGLDFAVNLYGSSPASPVQLTPGDYDSVGSTSFSSSIDQGVFNTGNYNNFTLNAAGLAAINPTGVTQFGYRESNYDGPGITPATSTGTVVFLFWSEDGGGATKGPKLVVTYSVSVGGLQWDMIETKKTKIYRSSSSCDDVFPGNGFITQWAVAAGQSITLPLVQSSTDGLLHYNCTIDWGDGSPLSTVTSYNDPNRIHTYVNAGTYNVEIRGTCEGWSFNNGGDRLKITGVVYWGDAGAFNGFRFLARGFYGCTNLTSLGTGVILPSGVGIQTDGFYYTFANCSQLTSIPVDLFRYNPAVSVQGFAGTFSGCESLISIPVDLFRYNILVSALGFMSVFSGCTSLISIPIDLFRYNPAVSVQGFTYAFSNCASLMTIPADLFRYNTAVSAQAFLSVFYGCTSLISLPVDLFRYNIAVSSQGFTYAFYGCTSLISVPVDFFRYNTAVTSQGFYQTFYGCPKLQLNANIFFEPGEETTRFFNVQSDFTSCFQQTSFSGIQGIAPQLWMCNFGETITLSTAPAADWSPGDIIVGQTSGSTAVVVSKVSSLVYQIYQHFGFFTLGETIVVPGIPSKTVVEDGAHPIFTGQPGSTSCFSGNTSASLINYDAIPPSWGGASSYHYRWGFEQSLPPPYQIPFTRCEPVNSYPPVGPLPYLAAIVQETVSNPPFKIPRPDIKYFDVLPRLLSGRGGWEAILPALYRKPYPQAVFPDVIFKLTGKWGWENTLPSPYRIPFAIFPCRDVLDSLIGSRWGWENSNPPSSRSFPTSPLSADGIPALPSGARGWESTLPSPSRTATVQAFPGDVFPFNLAGTSGWEFLGPLPSRLPSAQPPFIEVPPSIFKNLWGWEPALPSPSRTATAQSFPGDVSPFALAGISGWEFLGSLPSKPPLSQPPFIEVPPSIFKNLWGWEPALPSPSRPITSQAFTDDVRPFTLGGIAGWEFLATPRFKLLLSPTSFVDVPPSIVQSVSWGWESQSSARAPIIVLPFLDVPLPAFLAGTRDWETESRAPERTARQVLSFDDWWPGIVPANRVLPGGGYKPWYGWGYPEIYEDDDLRERLERNLYEIDEQLAALAAEEEEERRNTRIIVPELLPPGWRDDEQGDWRRDVRGSRQRREEEHNRQEQQDPYRHVHYNFASDLDFGVRRRIIGILDRAEHRRVNIFGSEAFRTSENALVKGSFVEQGTNAWVIRLDSKARLEIAREALAEGFKLLSFDDTSLSFIHRPTFPWKPVLLGAGAGVTIMGAGIFTGWLIWGRNPRK